MVHYIKTFNQDSIAAQLDDAILHAEETIRQTADEHSQAFKTQMKEKLGVDAILLREPYLENTLAWFSLKYIHRIERLRERSLLERKSDDDIPDITETITKETKHITDFLKQRLDETRQQSFGITHYVWHTREDDKVRLSHQANDGKICAWNNPPATGNPGDEFGCKCWAEPTLKDISGKIYDPPPDPSYALDALLLIVALLSKKPGLARRVGLRIIGRLRTINIFKRPKGVPENWIREAAKKGDGIKYVDPASKGGTYVRISRGNPNSSNPGQQGDYVRWQKNGDSLDKYGNVVPKGSQESHIPLKDFKFDWELFKCIEYIEIM